MKYYYFLTDKFSFVILEFKFKRCSLSTFKFKLLTNKTPKILKYLYYIHILYNFIIL